MLKFVTQRQSCQLTTLVFKLKLVTSIGSEQSGHEDFFPWNSSKELERERN